MVSNVRRRRRVGGIILGVGGGAADWWTTNYQTASGVDPVLALEYENDRYMADGSADTFANLHTFARASDATYVDSNGTIQTATSNEKRLDHDKDGIPLGLLIEESRTNLLTYSEQINDGTGTDWANTTGTFTEDFATAPDGATTATKHTPGTSDNGWRFRAVQNVTNGVSYTLSVFAKESSYQFVQLRPEFPGSSQHQNFDVLNGTVESGSASIDDAGIEDYGNGWFRCWAVVTSDETKTTGVNYVIVDSATSGSLEAFIGDGTSAILWWGAQLEEGAFRTSYIPTIDAEVTRAAETCSVATTAFGFNASAGALYAVPTPNHTPTAEHIIASLNDGTANERIEIVADASANVDFDVIDGGASQASIDSTVNAAADTQLKAAAAYAAGDFAVSVDGTAAQTDAAGTLPTVDTLVPIDNGHIKALVYYAERVPNSDLEALTA